jgi:hypothetical protein
MKGEDHDSLNPYRRLDAGPTLLVARLRAASEEGDQANLFSNASIARAITNLFTG